MNNAYKNMLDFWLDTDNLKNKNGFTPLGDHHICVGGVLMAAQLPQGGLRHLFVAASVLGDASFYFENNSASGLGGFMGVCDANDLKNKAFKLVHAAADRAGDMQETSVLPEVTDPLNVLLFAVAPGKLFMRIMKETEARTPENPFYPFFAYSQQIISSFKEDACQNPAQSEPKK